MRYFLLMIGVLSSVRLTFCSATSLQSEIKQSVSSRNLTITSTPRHIPPFTLLTDQEKQDVLCGKNTRKETANDVSCSLAVNAVWKRHRRWSKVASHRKRKVRLARIQNLVFLVSGAGLHTVAMQIKRYAWAIRLAGGACLAAAPLITHNYLSKEKISEWTRSRAISEGIKREVYTFCAGVAPYDGNSLIAIQTLVDNVASISESAKDLAIYFAMVEADNVPPPPRLDQYEYIHHRIDKQIEFYKKSAKLNAQKSVFLKRCKNTLAAGGALIGLLTGSVGGLAVEDGVENTFVRNGGLWAPTLAGASAAFAAHIHETLYDSKAEEWTASAQHLENLYLRLPQNVKCESEEWSNFVLDSESVIAASTQNWVNLSSGGAKTKQEKK